MTITRLLKRLSALLLCVTFTQLAFSQTKIITGTILDDKGLPVQGASVTIKGSKNGTTTGSDGRFSLTAPESARTLEVSSIGFNLIEVSAGDGSPLAISLVSSSQSLNDVVVIGYGTARRRDLTGSYSSITAKNFNSVPSATPDQLLQGKIAGLEVTVANGMPGGATQVKIRGNNSIRSGTDPLYVVDGVPLDGRSARPTFGLSGVGNLPDANPLTYLNPSEIESVTVLKDASASAIYGSRGANGVILITTRTGSSGPIRIDAAASVGTNGLMRQPDVLDAGDYRAALKKYNAKSDSGASFKPFDAIVQHKLTQNYSVALSGGGSDNTRYRASFLVSQTPGLIRKSGLNKYIANFNGGYKLLDKRLTINFSLTASATDEEIAPISNNPGSTGNLISNALQWNPTLLLKRGPLSYTANPNSQINPLQFSDAYNDHANVTTLLGSFTVAYKILPFLEYRLLYGTNYSSGTRGAELQGWITNTGGNADGKGEAAIQATQLFSQSLTHTLTFTKKFNDLEFTALAGYEYFATHYKTQFSSVYQFDYNLSLSNLVPIHYYDNIQDGKQSNLVTGSGNDPSAELQSYFARAQFNYKNKYSLSASFRADGSNKFGSNNRYGYFPAIAASWRINDENFMKDNRIFSNLALRVGWGKTGNQSFPAGSALDRFRYSSYNTIGPVNYANADLKWETVTSTDAGLDFGFFNGRLTGIFDVFFKKTTDPLYAATYPAPAPTGIVFKNLTNGAYVSNNGGELTLNAIIIQKPDFSWSVGGNVTYVKNKFVYPAAGTAPLVLAGQLNGKGTSATYVQAIANNQPLDVFFLRKFNGYDQNGFAITSGAASYAGDPNPKYTVGLTTELDYKKFALVVNMHGAYDFFIYNNTLQAVTGLSFINNGGNISQTLKNTPENPANPVSASTRYMSSGNYMKLGNATVRYNFGNIGKYAKNAVVYFTGNNIFVISKYPGFDPEVNVATADINGTGIPSRGIDYVGYPTVRSFTLGVNFSLY
ncbi:MAG: SusC/RagA family TonB-linked outer membrane protein [Puia sp.]